MIKFVYQNTPRGTGDAVLKCKKLIKSEYFLMLMPDDLIIKNNCSKSLIKLHKKYKSSIIASWRGMQQISWVGGTLEEAKAFCNSLPHHELWSGAEAAVRDLGTAPDSQPRNPSIAVARLRRN